MTDKFTKDYVLLRIEARKAALDLKIAEAEAVIEKADIIQMANIENWRAGQITLLGQALAIADVAITKGGDTPREVQTNTLPFRDALGKISQHGMPFLTQSNDSRYGSTPASLAKANADEWHKELVLLIHAEEYFKESPVTEYSIAGLRQLGLLNAVKFDITIPVKKG